MFTPAARKRQRKRARRATQSLMRLSGAGTQRNTHPNTWTRRRKCACGRRCALELHVHPWRRARSGRTHTARSPAPPALRQHAYPAHTYRGYVPVARQQRIRPALSAAARCSPPPQCECEHSARRKRSCAIMTRARDGRRSCVSRPPLTSSSRSSRARCNHNVHLRFTPRQRSHGERARRKTDAHQTQPGYQRAPSATQARARSRWRCATGVASQLVLTRACPLDLPGRRRHGVARLPTAHRARRRATSARCPSLARYRGRSATRQRCSPAPSEHPPKH